MEMSEKYPPGTLELWRPDGDFKVDWFMIELRWKGRVLEPEVDAIEDRFLASALPL